MAGYDCHTLSSYFIMMIQHNTLENLSANSVILMLAQHVVKQRHDFHQIKQDQFYKLPRFGTHQLGHRL